MSLCSDVPRLIAIRETLAFTRGGLSLFLKKGGGVAGAAAGAAQGVCGNLPGAPRPCRGGSGEPWKAGFFCTRRLTRTRGPIGQPLASLGSHQSPPPTTFRVQTGCEEKGVGAWERKYETITKLLGSLFLSHNDFRQCVRPSIQGKHGILIGDSVAIANALRFRP